MRKLLLIAAVMLLAGCSWLSPFKIEVQQGNYITQDQVAHLKEGMTRSQVRFLLGTPLLTDTFHKDRWDYIYRFEKDGKLIEDKRFTVTFDGDAVKAFSGDVMPSTKGFVADAPPQSAREKAEETLKESENKAIQTEAKKSEQTEEKEGGQADTPKAAPSDAPKGAGQ